MRTFTVNVTGVNDAPSFTSGADQTVLEDASGQTIAWATDISAGTGEGGQTVSFEIVNNSNPSLFSAGPVVSSAGVLTYTPAANQNGDAVIMLTIKDNGGTANGGVDPSGTQGFLISVTAVNDPPVAQAKNYTAQANMQISGLSGLLTGVTDADSGINGCTPTFSVAGVSGTTPAGGNITNLNAAAGTFDFNPPPGVTGNVTFTYTVIDDGCPGTATSAAATVTVNVVGPVIWFVNPGAASNGDGRLTSPFQFLANNGGADAADVHAANHRIFVYSGTVTGGLTLNANEWLVGQGVVDGSNSFDTVMGIAPPAGTAARPSINGARPTVSQTAGTVVTLGSGNVVDGLNVSNSNGLGIAGSNVGTLTLTDFDITVTGGTALSLTTSGTVTATGTGNDLTSTSGTALNVNGVTIGAAGLMFKSISSSGASSGIVLNNTGATAGLTVSGNGGSCTSAVTCTGGAIQNTTSHGVSLTSTLSPSFSRMFIQNNVGNGVSGTDVTNFTFQNGLINNSGTGLGAETSNIAFNTTAAGTENNLDGTVTITNNTLTNAYYHGVDIFNFSGTISSATISGNTITSSTDTATSKGGGIRFVAFGSASTIANVTTASIANNIVTNFPSGTGIQAQGGNGNLAGPAGVFGTAGHATNKIAITGNRLTGGPKFGAFAIATVVNGRGQGNFDISNNGTVANPITNSIGTAISLGSFGFANVTATINSNVIVANNQVGAPGIGAGTSQTLSSSETPNLEVTIAGNTISQTDGNGILVTARDATGTVKAKIQNNTVAAPLAGNRNGIRVDAGNGISVNESLCLNISGNTTAGVNLSPEGIGLRKQGTVAGTNSFAIHGFGTSPANQSQTTTFVSGQNPASANGTLIISGDNFNFPTCSLP